MFKRIRWLILGALGGVVAYLWAMRRMHDAMPQASQMVARRTQAGFEKGAEALSDLGARLSDAVREGRQAMREEEARLERELLTR